MALGKSQFATLVGQEGKCRRKARLSRFGSSSHHQRCGVRPPKNHCGCQQEVQREFIKVLLSSGDCCERWRRCGEVDGQGRRLGSRICSWSVLVRAQVLSILPSPFSLLSTPPPPKRTTLCPTHDMESTSSKPSSGRRFSFQSLRSNSSTSALSQDPHTSAPQPDAGLFAHRTLLHSSRGSKPPTTGSTKSRVASHAAPSSSSTSSNGHQHQRSMPSDLSTLIGTVKRRLSFDRTRKSKPDSSSSIPAVRFSFIWV